MKTKQRPVRLSDEIVKRVELVAKERALLLSTMMRFLIIERLNEIAPVPKP